METTKQVSVFLENKPGRLAQVLLALAREKVNVVALTIMDSHEHSVLRLVTNDLPKTIQVLDGLNAQHTQSDVLVVDLRNQPGALARVCEQLATEHVNIDYAYCSSGGRNGKVVGIFKVSNVEKALRVLRRPSANNNRRTEARFPRKQINAAQKVAR
ncbi:MAG: amino acid-binding protein [Planctomycetes bacterium]|nr:amino acid-binding protein [Planctomycetota bacterium]